MVEIEEPELSLPERITRDYILRALPSSFRNSKEFSESEIRAIKSIMAREYVRHGNLSLYWKTLIMVLIYDLSFALPAQTYGLILNILGGISLAVPALHTPETLAEDTFENSDDLRSKIKAKAETSVKTNIGVFGLLLGFVWQVLYLIGTIHVEVFPQNFLHGRIPSLAGGITILLMGGIIFGIIITD